MSLGSIKEGDKVYGLRPYAGKPEGRKAENIASVSFPVFKLPGHLQGSHSSAR